VTADLLRQGRLVICRGCGDCLREIAQYCWEQRGERDAPRKKDDHAMDDIRYFCSTVMRRLLRGIPEWRGIDDGTETLDM